MEQIITLPAPVALEEQAAKAAALLRILSNESRLLVLCHLVEFEELSVGELVERIGLGQSALSQHLAILRAEGLVATRKEATSVYYRICDPRARQILTLLHDIYCPEPGSGSAEVRSIGDKQ